MSNPAYKSVFAVVLAAGRASRFGSTKQLAELHGQALVRRALDSAVDACGNNTALVVGHDWQAVVKACEPLRGYLIVNDNYTDGLGTSIAQAARSIRHTADAVIILLADQPLITADHLRALCTAWSGTDDEIVATKFAEVIGTPALFPRGCFEDLALLDSDAGGQKLLSDERFRVTTINFGPAAEDVDTPDDLKRIARNARS